MEKNYIFGNGLIANSYALALRHREIKYEFRKIFSGNYGGEEVLFLNSNWRQKAPVSSLHPRGLSNYYHGVTDLTQILSSQFIDARSALGLPNFDANNFDSHSWTPWFPLRFNASKYVELTKTLEPFLDSSVCLCQSVIGNISTLFKEKLLSNEVIIGDHIVINIGSLDSADLPVEDLFILTKNGPIFRHFDDIYKSARFFIRPKFYNGKSVNFSESIDGRCKFIIKNLNMNKILQAIHLKTSYPRWTKFFDIYAQISIDNIYIFDKYGLRENDETRKIFPDIIADIKSAIKRSFGSFRPLNIKCNDILPGIHLYYDRSLLKYLPSNIKVLDTSLNPLKVAHPSIVSALHAYNFGK